MENWRLSLHVLLSALAAGCLTLAAAQSLLLALQDRLLHSRNGRPSSGSLIQNLPPLQTMESRLFQVIALGFLLLSASLLSGLWFIQDWFAQHLVNKTLLSISAWVIFGVLLWGRRRYGWRGRAAIQWVLSGYATLILAYFGSKYIFEEIINKTII